MNMNQLLDSIYANESDDVGLEKAAEQAFVGAFDTNETNPLDSMSLEELMKLASDLTTEDSVEEAPVEEEVVEEEVLEENVDQDELNKTAAAMLGGKMMAHSLIHEFSLIKEAVANGICRVCKQVEMDVEGSSVCSACLSEEG
jgi:hypothetical protein